MIWPLQTGDRVQIQYYSACGSYRYHAGNAQGTHSRVQISLV